MPSSRPSSPQPVCIFLARLLLEPGAVAPQQQTRKLGTASKDTSALPIQFIPQAIVRPLQGCSHSGVPLLVLDALPPDTQPLPLRIVPRDAFRTQAHCISAAPRPVFFALARLLVLQGSSHNGGPLLVLNALPPEKQPLPLVWFIRMHFEHRHTV